MEEAAIGRNGSRLAGRPDARLRADTSARPARSRSALPCGPRHALRLHRQRDRQFFAPRLRSAAPPVSEQRVGEEDAVLVRLRGGIRNSPQRRGEKLAVVRERVERGARDGGEGKLKHAPPRSGINTCGVRTGWKDGVAAGGVRRLIAW